MNVFQPSSQLRPFVKHYVAVSTTDEAATNRLLPDLSVTLAFRVKGETSYLEKEKTTALPRAVITGLRKGPRYVTYAPNSACLIAVIQPGAAGRFFRNAHALADRSESLTDIFPADAVCRLEDSLYGSTDWLNAIHHVERFLISGLTSANADLLVAEAIQRIRNSNGTLRIQALANELSISQDAFEKRFRREVGTSPKQFTETVRLRSVINQKSKHQSLTTLALDAGFFDSAHFSKVFRQFSGESPREFFKSPIFW